MSSKSQGAAMVPDILNVDHHPLVKQARQNKQDARQKFDRHYEHSLNAQKEAQKCRIAADKLAVGLIDATGAEKKRIEGEVQKLYDEARRHEDRAGISLDLEAERENYLKPFREAEIEARIAAAAEISPKVDSALEANYSRLYDLLSEACELSEAIFTIKSQIERSNTNQRGILAGFGLDSSDAAKADITVRRITLSPETRNGKGPVYAFLQRIVELGWLK